MHYANDQWIYYLTRQIERKIIDIPRWAWFHATRHIPVTRIIRRSAPRCGYAPEGFKIDTIGHSQWGKDVLASNG